MAPITEITQKKIFPEAPYNREEEYRRAQQAGSEAVMLGRETLATVVHQGEQLRNAENLADDTVYTAERANRVLRGMTWSGWLANKFSKPINPPEYRATAGDNSESKSVLKPFKPYEDVPDPCVPASQSVQNYHLNLQVLENCETKEQKGTCRLICDDMYRNANLKITGILADTAVSDETTKGFALQLKEDLLYLRRRQIILQQIAREIKTTTTATTADEKTKLFNESATDKSTHENLSLSNNIAAQQERHLNTLSEQCRELGFLAGNISISAEQQSEMVDSLDTKNETLHFKMNVMNRRTEQLIKDKSWGKRKAEFIYYAWIKHQNSGRYLSLAPDNDSALVLSDVFNEKSIFGIYKRGSFLGLQSKYNRRWVGQNLLGQITCSANSFNRRQEWEATDDWSNTTLLVVSAGWGAGCYLLLNEEGRGTQPIIGGSDFAAKRQAPLWCIKEFHES